MRRFAVLLAMLAVAFPAFAQTGDDGLPSNEKARKTYSEALDFLHRRMMVQAFDAFRKVDKQDDGHCVPCQKQIVRHGMELGEWKAAETAAEEMVGEAKDPKELALAHYQYGLVLMTEGVNRHKEDVLRHAHDEIAKAADSGPQFPKAVFADGRILAQLKQDDAAKQRFQQFVDMQSADQLDRQRALRYIAEPQLARARTVPPFAVTTLDGQRISLDDLQGKVVLIDFWATWCAPCRASIPHLRDIARKFADDPLVVLSISIDRNENQWKEFVAKNEMTWPQYFDGSADGSVARAFDVHAIPHTFTVDADGVLQDEQVGEASLEGKLKKLIKQAREMQAVAEQKQ